MRELWDTNQAFLLSGYYEEMVIQKQKERRRNAEDRLRTRIAVQCFTADDLLK